jgi:hypothetical protein
MQIFESNLQIINLIRKCREIENMDERIDLLQTINRLLPTEYEIKISSFITNDYVDKVLNTLEEKITNTYV